MNLLPDDNRFVRECLAHIPYNVRYKVMREYENIWKEGATLYNENAGRRTANLYLLRMVNEHTTRS